MSRHDRRRAKRKRHHTPLQGHSRTRKKLVTPFNQLPNLRPTNWVADQLPELLFAAAMLDAYGGSYEPVWAFLEALDGFVEEPKLVDGHMSSFQLVPSEERNEARAALAAPGVPPLPDEWKHALALYPDGPSAWLVGSESETAPSDPAVAIPYLQRLVRANFDSRSVPATRLRLVPIGRLVKAGRIRVPPDFLENSYIPRYPGGLTDDEQRGAESEIRAMYGALQAADRAQMSEEGLDQSWPSYFWRQNFRISVCEEPRAPASSSHPDTGSEPAQADVKPPTPAEFRDRLSAGGAALAEGLRDRQKRVELDLYAPEADEVKLGMASRQVRLLRLLLSDPHLWNGATGAHVLRSLVDGLITCTWLVQRDDPALYDAFRQYGLGKLKLFKLHMEDHLDERDTEPTDEQRAFLAALEDEVSQEFLEEFIDIDFGGSFAGVDVRQMAIEADLKPYYDLAYQPYSSESHGDWVSLRRSDLKPCANPLHRYHRIGRFDGPATSLHVEVIVAAIEVVQMTVSAVFESYGISVDDVFDDFEASTFGASAAPVAEPTDE
jgi:hypothetical protein